MSVNNLVLIGNVGKKPEQHFLQSGSGVVSFSLAVKRVGSQKQDTDWFEVRSFSEQRNKTIMEYLDAGKKIAVSGSIHIDTWEKDGQYHSRTWMKMKDFQMLERKSGGGQSSNDQMYGY